MSYLDEGLIYIHYVVLGGHHEHVGSPEYYTGVTLMSRSKSLALGTS